MNHHATLLRVSQPLSYTHTAVETTDVVYVQYERLGIDEARALTMQSHMAPRTLQTQTMIVAAQTVTVEAQNALLKLLEEPPVTTRFVFVLTPEVMLLPTLQSRFASEECNDQVGNNATGIWQAFVTASPAERIKQIEAWNKTKDTAWLSSIQQGLRTAVAGMTPTQSLLLIVQRLGTRGASNKMLLELLALEESLQNM